MSMTGDTLTIIKTNNQQGVESEIRKTQSSKKHITLWYDTDTWKIKDHTNETPSFVALDPQTSYTPPFEIKGVNLSDASETIRTLSYDKKYQTVTFADITEIFSTNSIHPINPSKIYLASSDTTATMIHLHG